MSYFQKVFLTDDYGNDAEFTGLNQVKTADSYKLVGTVFNTVANGDAPDVNFWVTTDAAGGTATVTDRECKLLTTTTSGSSTQVATNKTARYVAACQNYFRSITRVGDTGAVNNVRRWGVMDLSTAPANGYFFQLSATTFQVGSRKNGTDTMISSGSFNGDGTKSGQSYTITTNYTTFEIYYTNRKTLFVIDGVPIHAIFATTTALTATPHFKGYLSNINTGVGSAVYITTLVTSINKFGVAISQPRSFLQQGTTAGVFLKIGPGAIHSLNISGVANNSVITIYDNTAASGTVLYTTGAMGANTVPFAVPLDGDGGVLFEIGLTMVISGANSNCLIKYE